MNIAILIPTISHGGAERVAAEISKYFACENHNIFFFLDEQDINSYDFHGRAIKLKRTDAKYNHFESWHGTAYGLAERAAEVKSLKRKYCIDVSISFMERCNLINILSRVNDRIIIRTCTVLSSYNNRLKIYNKKLIAYLYNKSDCIIALSHYVMRDLVKCYCINKEKIKVIPNSVQTYEEDVCEEEWKYGDNVIICLARISYEKQQALLIDIFCHLKRYIPDAKLLLVGNELGAYASDIKKKISRKRERADIIVTGHVKNVKYYLRHSRLYVLLSKVEGFGNATIEAMSVGIPVICMDSPGAAREILAPHTRIKNLDEVEYAEYGILVPFIDENVADHTDKERKDLICKAIVNVMNDSEMQTVYYERGKARAKMFSISRVGKLWDEAVFGNGG